MNEHSEGETEEGSSSNTDCDQDREVSFMEDTDDEDRFTPRNKMDKKSSNKGWLQHWSQSQQSSGKTEKRWEDDINQFLKPDETEATKGDDSKNNDTWIWAAKDQNGKKWKTIVSRDRKHNGSRRHLLQ